MFISTRHASRAHAVSDRVKKTLHVDLEPWKRNLKVLDGIIEMVYAELMARTGKRKLIRRGGKKAWSARERNQTTQVDYATWFAAQFFQFYVITAIY